jgi:hypothetical protein
MTEPFESDRRKHPRTEIDAQVAMICGGRGVSCMLKDISVAGMSVSCSSPPQEGDDVVIYLSGVGRFDARVMRIKGRRVALSFITGTQEQWNQVKKLSAVLAEERGARPRMRA